MAAVCAEYGGAVRLPQAEQEAAHLSKEYGAAPVAGLGPAVLRCLGGDPPGDIVHFAMHGKVDPGGTQDGLLMADGRWLDPAEVRGVERARARLVFLNACQVGQGEEMLGDYAGLAAAFLSGGAQAVVAPLWKVDDEVARTFAEGFYAAVLRDGMAPAEYLRRQRLSVRDEAGSILAYLFFGHPLMRVEWSGSS
jgi:CHAT domain-containing protein